MPEMKRIPLTQGTPEWHAWRRGGVGGSDAPIVMGDSPYCTATQLWEIKTGRRAEQAETWPMRRGKRLEPVARGLLEERLGLVFEPACLEHGEHSWWRSSLDCLTAEGGVGAEIKAPKKEDHATALAGGVPRHYWAQCHHQIGLSRVLAFFYVSFNPDSFQGVDQLAIVPVVPDPVYVARVFAREAEFWLDVLSDRDAAARLAAEEAAIGIPPENF